MPCYSPVRAYPGREVNPETGKRPLTFSGQKNLIEGSLYTVPCGGCLGCRIDRGEAWAIRSVHEAKMNSVAFGGPGSSFLTLTFDPEHLPTDNSVRLDHMQKFMKLLRYYVGPGVRLRYLLCGEYGDRKGRAHYHVLVFGYGFPDRKPYKRARDGSTLFSSELLSKAWPYGYALIGDVTWQSARYVGGYVTKKIGGEKAPEHYTRQSPVDGNFYRVEPEFAAMSKKPGLGESFFRKFHSDVFPSDECIIEGRPHKPPRYYEKLMVEMFGEASIKRVKRKRRARAVASRADATPQRLATREECKHRKVFRFEREVE